MPVLLQSLIEHSCRFSVGIAEESAELLIFAVGDQIIEVPLPPEVLHVAIDIGGVGIGRES